MSEWRNDFNLIYKLVKSYCCISNEKIANAINVEIDSVRQYSSRRKTMPDNINPLCELFEDEIDNLNDTDKKKLLFEIQNNLRILLENTRCKNIGHHICAMMKQCYFNEKTHMSYFVDYPNNYKSTGHIQAVVFDFDGTLTNTKSRTTWESLWEMLGYVVRECQNLHKQYDKGCFTHQEWCNKTADKFIEKKLTRQQVLEVAKKNKIASWL